MIREPFNKSRPNTKIKSPLSPIDTKFASVYERIEETRRQKRDKPRKPITLPKLKFLE